MVVKCASRSALKARPEHVEAFKSIAHLNRLRVFFFLVKRGKEVTVGEIQEALEIPGPTLSHHLETLRRAGLIRRHREKRRIYCSVDSKMVTDLVRLLSACC